MKDIGESPIRNGLGKKYAFFREGSGTVGRLSVWNMPAESGEILMLGRLGAVEYYMIVLEMNSTDPAEYRFYAEKLSRTRFKSVKTR